MLVSSSYSWNENNSGLIDDCVLWDCRLLYSYFLFFGVLPSKLMILYNYLFTTKPRKITNRSEAGDELQHPDPWCSLCKMPQSWMRGRDWILYKTLFCPNLTTVWSKFGRDIRNSESILVCLNLYGWSFTWAHAVSQIPPMDYNLLYHVPRIQRHL